MHVPVPGCHRLCCISPPLPRFLSLLPHAHHPCPQIHPCSRPQTSLRKIPLTARRRESVAQLVFPVQSVAGKSDSASTPSTPSLNLPLSSLRLKLRCDRAVPCGSCVKRGCAAICPDGTHPSFVSSASVDRSPIVIPLYPQAPSRLAKAIGTYPPSPPLPLLPRSHSAHPGLSSPQHRTSTRR